MHKIIGLTGLFKYRQIFTLVWKIIAKFASILKRRVTKTITSAIITFYSHNFCTVAARLWRPSYMQNTKFYYANRVDAWTPHSHCIEINPMKMLFMIIFCGSKQKEPSPGGLEPPTFRLTAERANRLRHGNFHKVPILSNLIVWFKIFTYVRFPLHYLIFLARSDMQNTRGVGY